MEAIWFCLLTWMFGTFVVLGGSDLGVGVLHLFVAKSESERLKVLGAIGPVWKGNEVWLVAAGGTMLLAFPRAMAVSFSGFYLPLIIILWLLIFRALGIEIRQHVDDRLWKQFWDVSFSAASLVLAVFFGAAIGNVVRGVSLNERGVFFAPLWTDFRVGEQTGILDWYTVFVALAATAALAHHAALWLSRRADGAVRERADRVADRLWLPVLFSSLVLLTVSFVVQPGGGDSVKARPWGVVFPLVALGSLFVAGALRKRKKPGQAFLASAAYLYGMMATAAIGVYPYILPARNPAAGLTVHDAAAGAHALRIGLFWWIPGMLMVCGYFVFLYRWILGRERTLGLPGDPQVPHRSQEEGQRW